MEVMWGACDFCARTRRVGCVYRKCFARICRPCAQSALAAFKKKGAVK